MGRSIKQGLSYFPMDTDFFEDEKIQFVSARFGIKGDGIVLRLMCRIYRNGYFLKFDNDVALLFARSVGDIGLHGLVNDVVNELLKRGFFDDAIFKRFGLLTSKGIQRRYAKICTDAKRKGWSIDREIDLIQEFNGYTPEEMIKTPEEMTQSKVKKKKVKKNNDCGGGDAAPPPPKKTLEEKQKEMLTRQKEFYAGLVPFLEQYGKEMIRAFYNHWSEPNKSKTKFKMEMQPTWDLSRRLSKWESNQYKFENGAKQKAQKPEPQTPSLKTISQ